MQCTIDRQKPNVYVDPSTDPCYEEKLKLISDIKERVGSTLDGIRPLNIAVIGRPGGGKSSFLNSVFVSFSMKEWRELAKAGAVGGGGDEQGTVIFKSYTKEDYYQEKDHSLLPTFLDMKGFEDEETQTQLAIMELVLNGRIQDTEDLDKTLKKIGDYGTKGVLESHNKHLPKLYPVDRIIVVCTSNTDSQLPESLFKVIKQSAREQGGIPIYGVLTCKDTYPDVGQRIKVFKDRLGLSDERFAHISNYCAGVDPDMIYKNTYIPSLDVPLLDFIKQVLTTCHRDPKPKPKPKNIMYFLNLLAVFVLLVGVFVFLYCTIQRMGTASTNDDVFGNENSSIVSNGTVKDF